MAGGKFGGGAGTTANPYIIEDAEDLNEVRRYLTSSFKLTNNINLGVPPYNSGSGWFPIQGAYTGTFDGNGKAILNMYINRPTETGVGLFEIFNGNCKDLGFINSNILGLNSVGTLAGISNPTVAITLERIYIINAQVKGTGAAGSNYHGGLIGLGSGASFPATIKDIHIEVNITGSYSSLGAFIGYYGASSSNGTKPGISYVTLVPSGYLGNSTYNRAADGNALYVTVDPNTCFFDSTATTYTQGAFTAKTTAELKDVATLTSYSARLVSGASNANVNGKSMWILKNGTYPRLYSEIINKIFILTDDLDYRVWNGTSWEIKHSTVPTREEFTLNSMATIDTIPYTAWELLKSYGSVKLVNFIEKTNGATLTSVNVALDYISSSTSKNVFSKTFNFEDYGSAISTINNI